MTTHILSMTYGPKIESVFSGECGQTTRLVRSDAPWHIGDKAIIHTWTGLPYRTPWGRRLDTHVSDLLYLYLERGVGWFKAPRPFVRGPVGPMLTEADMDEIARLDFIDPPNASAFTNTLMALNGLTCEQMYDAMFRIIRWPILSMRAIGALEQEG